MPYIFLPFALGDVLHRIDPKGNIEQVVVEGISFKEPGVWVAYAKSSRGGILVKADDMDRTVFVDFEDAWARWSSVTNAAWQRANQKRMDDFVARHGEAESRAIFNAVLQQLKSIYTATTGENKGRETKMPFVHLRFMPGDTLFYIDKNGELDRATVKGVNVDEDSIRVFAKCRNETFQVRKEDMGETVFTDFDDAYAHWRARRDAQNPPYLTYDQLIHMDGEPVTWRYRNQHNVIVTENGLVELGTSEDGIAVFIRGPRGHVFAAYFGPGKINKCIMPEIFPYQPKKENNSDK